ncbi:MAG: carboxypeptidase-like regulatory domain-containing protein, partial [Muribaculaceae bacterium]|nr:carboxypeptidase-like regulatory domain-containing protein [Muribaculaceae bacterium]
MKTRYFLAALLCGAVIAPAAQAKTAEELRIYINPGHGSWTGGDRNMGTIKHGEPKNINDTLGFFESNTDLWKCLGMVDRLEEYGLKIDRTLNQDNPNRALVGAARDLRNNIFMSRVKNGPGPDENQSDMSEAYNRSLYEICCEVERNNFDMFFSLHSNAATSDLVNYPSLFLRGENKVAGVEGSDTNARTAWPFAWDQDHMFWTHYSRTNPNVIYDVDFWGGDYAVNNIDGKTYKGYYGVLRHGVMGYMAEGYFHTYGPARHRAMNIDVCYDEGDAYARGMAEIFGLAKESNGTLYGIVRDQHESFRHQYYNATTKSNDNFKPLNGVKVELLKDGKVVREYTTDDEWNGAFVFNRLEPGEYYVTAALEGYKAAEPFGPFTVEAAKTTYPCIWLENVDYVAPEPDPDIYVDPVTTPLIGAADTYVMSTAIADKEVAELDGKTIRRVIARDENVYVLALDADQKPTLLVLDADLNVKGQLGTANCKGSDRDLADIQFTADGVLVGSSASITHFSSATIDSDFGDTKQGSVNFYRWDNNADGVPEGEAKVWFTTLASGNLYRGLTANTFVYTGTSKNGQFAFPTASSYSAERMFFSYVEIIDGEVQNFSINNTGKNTEYLAQSVLGLDYTFSVAPYDNEVFIVNAPGQPVRSFNIMTLEAAGDISAEHIADELPSTSFFKYAGHSYMAVPAVGGPALVDVTDGAEAAKAVT